MDHYSRLLNSFETQLAKLTMSCSTLSDKTFHESLFDPYLFKMCKPEQLTTPLLNHYLNEIESNILLARKKILQHQQDQIIYLVDKITNQLIAIARELASHDLRLDGSDEDETIYQKYGRYINYERRLIKMKQQLCANLAKLTHSAEKKQLSKKIVSIDERLHRCRLAIKKLYHQISTDYCN